MQATGKTNVTATATKINAATGDVKRNVTVTKINATATTLTSNPSSEAASSEMIASSEMTAFSETATGLTAGEIN